MKKRKRWRKNVCYLLFIILLLSVFVSGNECHLSDRMFSVCHTCLTSCRTCLTLFSLCHTCLASCHTCLTLFSLCHTCLASCHTCVTSCHTCLTLFSLCHTCLTSCMLFILTEFVYVSADVVVIRRWRRTWSAIATRRTSRVNTPSICDFTTPSLNEWRHSVVWVTNWSRQLITHLNTRSVSFTRFFTCCVVCLMNERKNNRFIALWSRITRVSRCSHKGETYWNNHWIFMRRMSFLPLDL